MPSTTPSAERLTAVHSWPRTPRDCRVKTARDWFDHIDADKSGAIEANEVRDLYRQARGELLKPKELADAMKMMDIDGGGTVEFEEFAVWWLVALCQILPPVNA